MPEKEKLEKVEEKTAKFRKGFDIMNDIGQVALSATGIFHIVNSFLGIEPPEDAPKAAKLIYGGLLTPEDEALLEGIEQELRESNPEIQDSLDRLRAHFYRVSGEGPIGDAIAKWYLNAFRKQVLHMRHPERIQTVATEVTAGKGSSNTTRTTHKTVPVNTEVAKKFIIKLYEIDNEAREQTSNEDEKDLKGCEAMSTWLHLKSMPGPSSAQKARKMIGPEDSIRNYVRETAQKSRQREAALPWWDRWLRN